MEKKQIRMEPQAEPRRPEQELAPSGQGLVPALIEKAIDKGVSVEILERLVALNDKIRARAAEEEFFHALSGFQGECPPIPKSVTATIESDRGRFDYSYAPLEKVIEVAGPYLKKWGFSWSFVIQLSDTYTFLSATAILHHSGGHHTAATFTVPVDPVGRMKGGQRFAAAATFAKRHAFLAVTGIVTADTDDDMAHEDEIEPPKAATIKNDTRGKSALADAIIAILDEPSFTGKVTFKGKVIDLDEVRKMALDRIPDAEISELKEILSKLNYLKSLEKENAEVKE